MPKVFDYIIITVADQFQKNYINETYKKTQNTE